MSLLFWEGFDNYGNINDLKAARPEVITNWNTRFGWDPSFSTTAGRFGKSCVVCDGNVWGPGLINISSLGYTPTEIYTGRAIYLPQGYSDGNGFLQIFGNAFSSSQGDIWFTIGSGILNAWNFNGTMLGQTPFGHIKVASWLWIEVRAKLSSTNVDADGIVEVWINGVKVISNLACITKRANTSTAWGGTSFQNEYADGGNLIDDIYITDTVGSAPWNSRLGDLRIATVAPNTDVGANSGTPSTGTTHWGVIDEIPKNTTDYIIIPNVSGNKELFYHNNIPTIANTVFAVSIQSYQQKSDAGLCSTHAVFVSNGSGYMANANTYALSTSWATYRDSFTLNPETSSTWTYNEVSNTQIGLVVDP